MFDPPAGRITGNIVNLTNPETTVFGYFYATEQDTVVEFVEPDFDTQDFFCLRDFSGMPPETCADCAIWANTGDEVTIMRPDEWPDE